MKILGIDTATERCSVAAHLDGQWIERSIDTQRGHAENVLTMVDEVLKDGAITLADLDGIAYGRGPGAFTGVRIAIGVVQGLAFGARLPTVGVSNLAAVAQQAPQSARAILVCMDARMNEVYWAMFKRESEGLVIADGPEQLSAPADVTTDPASIDVVIGSALAAYPELATRYANVQHQAALPRAREIVMLAEREFMQGRGRPAFEVQPVYLRDQVVFVKPG